MDNHQIEETFTALETEQDVLRKSQYVLQLRNDAEIPVKTIAEKIQKHPSYISHLLRLRKLPQLVIDGYYAEQISATHLMILARLDSESEMVDAYEEILKNSLTANQTESLIRQLKYDIQDDGGIPPETFRKVEKQLQKRLESKVKIYQSRVRGKISIEKRGNTSQTSEFIKEIVGRLERELTKEEKDESSNLE